MTPLRPLGILLALSIAALASAAGCSSSSSSDPGGGSGGSASDAAIDGAKPQCVPPGTPNNEVGIGGYCEPGGTQCITDAGIRICTGDVEPQESWFCTRQCAQDSDCGTGAYCDKAHGGSGCVPLICQ